MEYIKLEDNLRLGYEIRVNYFTDEYIRDLVSFDEILGDNLYTYTNYAVNGLKEVEELAEELGEYISLLDTLEYDKYSKDVIEDIEESLFTEEEWIELVGDKTKEEILKDLLENDNELKELKELKEILANTKIDELYYYKEIIIEWIEKDQVNNLLNNTKVIQGAWIGYSQGDYIEYFSLIRYDTEEERELLENEVEDKFEYLNMLFSGEVYDIEVILEKQKPFKELGGERIELIWVTEEEDHGGILIDYSNMENYIRELAKEITNKKYHEQIEDEKLSIDIIY